MPVLAAIDVDQAPQRPVTVGYDLATAYDDTLVVMYVMPEEEYNRWRSSRDDLPEEFSGRNTISQAKEYAARQAADAVDATIDEYDRERVESRGSVGEPADEILAAVAEIDPRYVVVGGRKQPPIKQTIFGSVSQAIVREADQPVVTLTEETD